MNESGTGALPVNFRTWEDEEGRVGPLALSCLLHSISAAIVVPWDHVGCIIGLLPIYLSTRLSY